MRREIASLLVVAVLALTLPAIVSATTCDSSADVAYIYKSSSAVDYNVVAIFEELGLKTKFISESSIPSNLSKYKLVFIGDESFRNTLPVGKYPTVIMNGRSGEAFGLTDVDGVSKMSSNQPLEMVATGEYFQAYTRAKDVYGNYLSYYFLDKSNSASAFEPYALTSPTSSGSDFGYAVAFAESGSELANGKELNGNLCFFGVYQTKYWTADSEDMFKDCVLFVLPEIIEQNDSDGNSTIPDDNQTIPNDGNQTNPGNFTDPTNQTGACTMDYECDDHNSSTLDRCMDSGSPQSYCIHVPVSIPASHYAYISSLDYNATARTATIYLRATLMNSTGIQFYSFSLDGSNWTLVNETSLELNYTFSELTPLTNYTSYVAVTDVDNNTSPTASIEFATLALPTAPVEPVVETSSSGGSGDRNGFMPICLTKWVCTEWSECLDGSQTRECNLPEGRCKPSLAKPKELQACEVKESKPSIEIPLETETEKKESYFKSILTGAVIGARDLASKPYALTIFFIVLLIALLIVSAIRGHKEALAEEAEAEKAKEKEEKSSVVKNKKGKAR